MSIITFCAAGSAKSPRRVLLIAVVIMAVSLVFALRLQVSTDISALMPAHSRISGTLLEVMSLFGTTDRLILVIESADGAESEDASNRRLLRELADQVGRGMEQSGLIDAVDYRITPEQRAFYEQLYFGHPFHFHAADALEGLRARLAADYIEKQVAELAKSLRYSPMGAAAQRQLLLDPLGFRSGQQASLGQGNVAGFRVDLSDGYFFSRDGRSVFIIARPAFRSQDIVADARLMEEMENILAGAGGEGVLQADYSMALGDGFGARLLGPYVETLYGSQAAQEELLPTILLTCLGLLLLFAVVFRSIRLFMVLLVPVVAGILVTAGLTAVFSGHLTMITVGFAAMLAGLGIDFGIHLADRVGEESAGAGDMRTWILTACTTTGKGVVAGGLTSAVIFMLIGTSEFAALRQFGWIVGVGIVLTLIATFTLLPALLVKIPVPIRRPRKALLAAWAQWMVSHHRLVGLAGIAITGALGYAALQLSIENNIYELGPMNQGYERQKDRILSESGGTTNVVMAVVTREELEDSLRVSEQVADVLEELQARGAIESYAQVASVLPSDHSQQATIEEVREWDLAGSMGSFEIALDAEGFKAGGFQTFIDSVLAYTKDGSAQISFEDLRDTPAADDVNRFLAKGERGWEAIVYMYPQVGEWEDRVPGEVVSAIEGLGQDVVVTGIVPSFNEISDYVKKEFLGLTMAALLVVLFIAILLLKRPLLALMATVPAVLGLIWTLGLMKFLGIELNLVTILVAPLIIGLGIDYALHVLNRHVEQPDSIGASTSSVSRAIFMTSATTIVGFGSLAFADLASLRSLGLTVSLGMVCCTLTSLVILPAMLSALAARK